MPKCRYLNFPFFHKRSKVLPEQITAQEDPAPHQTDDAHTQNFQVEEIQNTTTVQLTSNSNLNSYQLPSNSNTANIFPYMIPDSRIDILLTCGYYDHSSLPHYTDQDLNNNHKEDFVHLIAQNELIHTETDIRQDFFNIFTSQLHTLYLQFLEEKEVIMRNQFMRDEVSWHREIVVTNKEYLVSLHQKYIRESQIIQISSNIITPSTTQKISSSQLEIAESMWDLVYNALDDDTISKMDIQTHENKAINKQYATNCDKLSMHYDDVSDDDYSDIATVDTIVTPKQNPLNALHIAMQCNDSNRALSYNSSNNLLSNFPSLHDTTSRSLTSSNPLTLPSSTNNDRLSPQKIESTISQTHNLLAISRDNSFTSNTHSTASPVDLLNVLGDHSAISWHAPSESHDNAS